MRLLLYHTKFYLHLASGRGLMSSYRAAVDLLRSGRWRSARTENVGRLLQTLGVDLDAAFDAVGGDSGADDIDFAASSIGARSEYVGQQARQ